MKEFRCHDVKPKEHVLVYTTLFPNSRQPTHGVFVNERIRHLGKYYNIKVVAPVHVTTKVKSYFSGGKIPAGIAALKATWDKLVAEAGTRGMSWSQLRATHTPC